jgi:hypothetical protein
MRMSLAAVAHLTEGVCLNALLALGVENSLICLAGTQIPTNSVHDAVAMDFAFENMNKK